MIFETLIFDNPCRVRITEFIQRRIGLYAGHPDSRYDSEELHISWELLDETEELTDGIIERIDREAIDFVDKNGGFVPLVTAKKVIPLTIKDNQNMDLNNIFEEIKSDLMKIRGSDADS